MQEATNSTVRTVSLPDAVVPGQWPTALAPMQDVTNLPYMRVVSRRGSPDYYFTEYFRVHGTSRLDPRILRSITENPDGRPVFAQLIGENLVDLRRTVRTLREYPVAGIDLNMGCPAPRVYKKNVGGGLLRDPQAVDRILGTLREETTTLFTVKMRIGFADDRLFETLLSLVSKHNVDLLSLHVRTVQGGYRSEPSYAHAKHAVDFLPCPVLLNGNISTSKVAHEEVIRSGAYGAMIGRAAIRNPWIFKQIRQMQANENVFQPNLEDAYIYVEELYEEFSDPKVPEEKQVARMKKFLNFVGLGVDPRGEFLHKMRRSRTKDELFSVCSRFMREEGRGATAFHEHFPSVVSRVQSPALLPTISSCSSEFEFPST
ncbi:MAG: dihydrouridine synthase [Opitutae bacterium]|nr:dihydrouridine synthase [Opitutae bacterium]